MDIAKYAHLLSMLAYDDGFRQSFLDNPEQELTNLGIDPTTAHLPKPLVKLPPKEILQKEYESRLKHIANSQTCPLSVLV